MRKITLFFVALMSVLMLSAATETVYFVNANNWTGTIKAHLWGGTATGTSWNGNAMTKESEQIAGFDVYSYSAEAGAYANVIFNNGSAQTADLTWTAGKYYVKDGWYTKDEAVVKLGQPIEYETVYFVDAYKWGSVNIYTWTPEVGTWPGKAMTKESEQIAGYDVYSYTVEKGTSFGGLNFNCKGDNSKKTGDLKWTAGKYYVKDAWYTKEEAEKGLAPSVKLAGTLSSWDGTVMELSDDYKTASLTLTLDAKEYELKIIEEGAWFGNAGTMTRGNSSDWTFSSEVGDNCKITADVAGEYVFTWTFETNKLTVTYPELAPAITATWSIEEGAELESFTEATITFTGVESAKAKSSYSNYILYSVAEDGTLTLAENVPGYSSPGYLDTKASGTAVTFYDSEGMYDLASGNYRIVLPVGAIKFNNDNANLSTEEYVLNFVIKNNKVVLPEVDAVYTVNPENNATVTEIREIVLNFTGYEAIAVAEPDMVNGSNIPTVYFEDELTGSMMPAGYIMFKADSLSANGLRLYVDPMYTGGAESYATEGNYAINIPAGVVTFSDGINKAITLNYTVEAAPAEPEAISIADFLTKEVNAEVWYELTGVVSAISNTTYGNFDLIDETGTVYVYGLTATQVNPNDKSFATLGLENGDTLTLRGVRADYNGTAQVGGPAYYVSHKDYVAPEVVLPEGQSQETIDFTPTDVYANAEKLTVVDGTNISLTFAQNSGGTAPAWYTTGTAARLYGQNSLTVAAKEGYVLVSVQFVIGDKDIPSADNSTVTNGTYNYDTHTWTATEGADVTEMVLTNTKSSGHFRIQKVIVTLQEKVEEPVEPTPTIVEGIKLYIQLPATYTVVNSSVTFGEKATGGKLSPVKRGMSIGGGTTTTGTEMTNVDAENGVWEVVAPAGTSDSLFSVAFSFKGYTAACNIANLKYDGEHNLFTLSSDFAFDIRRGGTATEANGTWGVYPFPAPAITATWSIEEGAELESFTEATITFTGVESATTTSMYPACFYKVAEDGTLALVENYCTAGVLDRTATGASIKLWVDEETGCYEGKITAGNYRIVLSAGMIKFNNDNSNKNTEDYVLNFSIAGSDEPALEEIDAVYTVNPENNANVTEIREIVLNFTGYETIAVAEPDMVNGRNIPTVYFEDELTGSMMPAGYIMFKADTASANGLRLYVDPAYTGGAESYATEGKYAINIPAGVVTFSDGISKAITLNYTVKAEEVVEPTTPIVEGTKLYVQFPTAYSVLQSSVTFGKKATGGKLSPVKRGMSIGGGTIGGGTTTGTAMTKVDAENGVWEVVAPAGTSDSLFSVVFSMKGYTVACNIADLKYDGEHNLFTLSSDFTFDIRKGGTATEANGTWGVYPFPAPGITATWSIEEGAELESFTEVTITFTGVEAANTTTMYPVCFYKVAADGTTTPVANDCTAGLLNRKASGASITLMVQEDEYDVCYKGKITGGNYRIVLSAGMVKFNNDNSNKNTEEYVLNFSIAGSDEPALEEIDAVYTVNPENNANITEIREIVLNFTGYETIAVAEPDMVNGSNIPTIYFEDELTGAMMPAGYIMFKADSLSANGLRLYVDPMYTGGAESYAAEGKYAINIPAGVVTFSDGINKAITLNYTIIEESLPMEVEFENIAAIYEMGMWDMAYYESYDDYNVVALLKSQPTVVDKVVTSTMRGGNMNNYYLNDGTGVIVLQTEGDIINPIMDENYENIIGYDTIPGLNIEVGKKLPVDFMANINFKTVTDDETYLPTGEVYGAPVMTFVPKATGDTIVDEEGFETIVTESNEEFAARCEASDFVEEAVEANLDDVLANRIAYAGKLLVLDTTANYYAAVNPYMGGMSAYMYWDATEAFDVEVLEEEGTTVVYVSPKYTEDNNNFVGKLFNVIGEELPEAAFDAAATINVVNARFDWNSIAQCQTLLLKEGYEVVIPESPKDNVENNDLGVNIYSNNGSVYVETEAGAMIEVYTVNGLRVYAGVSNTNTTVINGLNTNIAIIRVNGETYKVFVK